MSEPNAQGPQAGEDAGQRERRRVRKRVRVRTGRTRSQRLKTWWREHDSNILLWGVFALAVLVLFALVYTGQLRAPAPPPPE